MKEQQKETYDYFDANVQGWEKKAFGDEKTRVNIIKQRNAFSTNYIKQSGSVRSFLDVGCGVGDLVAEVAGLGVSARGVDFAPNMIETARKNSSGIDNASFEVGSFFDFDFSGKEFDLVSANGFIEYIQLAELKEFFSVCKGILSEKGSLIVGSRNKLFNVFSLNDYTRMEFAESTKCFMQLVEESILLNNASDISVINDKAKEHARLASCKECHPITAIGVSQRHQYTPIELASIAAESGFSCVGIKGVHYHGFSPKVKQDNLELFTLLANSVESIADNNVSIVPQSSTFMMRFQLR